MNVRKVRARKVYMKKIWMESFFKFPCLAPEL